MQEPPAWAMITHLLGAALFVGATLVATVIVLRGELDLPRLWKLSRTQRVAMFAIVAQLLVGGYLFSLDAASFGKSPVFGVKMTALVLAGVLNGLAARKVRRSIVEDHGKSNPADAARLKQLTVASFALALMLVGLGFVLAATA